MPAAKPIVSLTCLLLLVVLPTVRGQKPPLTLDEFFNAVDIRSVQISPDGHAVVIETMRPDWSANRFRNDLWLYRDDSSGSLVQLTQSGHDSSPQWSPDGRWIAFLSDRKTAAAAPSKVSDDADADKTEKDVAQLYVIPPYGGKAFPVTFGNEEIHAFAWSADSRRIYFATRKPWTRAEKEAYAEEWRDVIRSREPERGDVVFGVEVAAAVSHGTLGVSRLAAPTEANEIAAAPYRVDQMAASPNGNSLALTTSSPSGYRDSPDPYGIYVVDLPKGGAPHLILHTAGHPQSWAGAGEIRWSPNSTGIFFIYDFGTPEGPFEIPQTRLYWVPVASGKAIRWAPRFAGHVASYAMTSDGSVLLGGLVGTEVKTYLTSIPDGSLAEQPSCAGTYGLFSVARGAQRVAFVFSSLQQPPEAYIADSPHQLDRAKPITAFNKLFTERELPRGKTYRWQADDGVDVEGMLIYPPGQFEAKDLPMFTLIHGGPEESDGNYFEADWYKWAALAATDGWLVFEPNYRGSLGYGDAFTLGIVPYMNSRPGKDILEGVDALVKDGIADLERLTVGGYSAGGNLTNWLITQTTRFKAAVTGAGSVEEVASWGSDNAPVEHAYMLGGVPWETESNYNAEAPIWLIGKVTTPTHIVAGSEDINVPVLEDYLLERALQTRGIPHSLLIFPGEGHELDKNPWYGKIKVREELKWLEKYGRKSR